MVVIDNAQLHSLTIDYLNDESSYEKLPKNSTERMQGEINRALKTVMFSRAYPQQFYSIVVPPEPTQTQCFSGLPKTHKKTLKIHPIVSGGGGIFIAYVGYYRTP